MRFLTIGTIVAAAMVTLEARADTAPIDKKVCIAAAERGQELRDSKQMRDARSQFSLCARPECPTMVSVECKKWVAEAEAAMASVRLAAVDEKGTAVTAVRVLLDGQPWLDEIPREAVFLDPGSHEIRFERAGAEPVVHTIALAMGERDHGINATFLDPSAKAKPEKEKPPQATGDKTSSGLGLPIALGAVGAAAIGGAVVFWLLGNSDLDDARARCKVACPPGAADSAKTKHIVGDVMLSVGVVSLGVAAYFFFTRKPDAAAAALSPHGVAF